MSLSKMKLLFCLMIGLTLLFAPVVLEIAPDGKTYAFSSKKGNKISGFTAKTGAGDNDNTFGFEKIEPNPNSHTPPTPVPEPATMLLVGGGMLGLAAFRKKFRKK